jgi:serine/threonine protein kinase
MNAEREGKATPVQPSLPTAEFMANSVEDQTGNTPATVPNAVRQGSSSSSELFPCGRLLGQYRILEHLGSGGMGQVYKAVHSVMERVVALKIMAPRLMRDELARARFQREVRNAARLIHPNIVVAYDAAEVEGVSFLVMEYVEGWDAARLLSLYGRPSTLAACEIGLQVALGLQYAHECGMVHRDIKPANLMLRCESSSTGVSVDGWPAGPVVKILDFGLARLAAPDGVGLASSEGLTREGFTVGTPEYMAPEQARNSGVVDIRCDIYSLGCTLYQLLSGRPPFRALSIFDLTMMHLHQTPEPLLRYCPELSPELAAVVQRMLAKKPEERFQTPAEAADALKAFTSSPPTSPNVSLPAPVTRALEKPPMPPAVMMMHFQAFFRTFLFVFVLVVVGVGCLLYLPDLGSHLQNLWNRITTHSSKTSPFR